MRWIAIGAAIAALALIAIVQSWRPPIVNITSSDGGKMTYEFSDLMTAARFAVANGKTGADIR